MSVNPIANTIIFEGNNYNNILKTACVNGYIELAQWLCLINPDAINSINNEYIFYDICATGNVETAQWFINIPCPDINMDLAFRIACIHNNLKIAQLIYNIYPTVDISRNDDDIFRTSCTNGFLELAQWIFSIKPDIINNISLLDDWLFRETCIRGKLNVLKWLLLIKPDIDISAKDNYAFREICKDNQIQIAQWFVSISPDYHITIINDTISSYYVVKTIPCIPLPDDITPPKESCPICYENNCNIITNCNHFYCDACIQTYTGKNCPMCRNMSVKYFKYTSRSLH